MPKTCGTEARPGAQGGPPIGILPPLLFNAAIMRFITPLLSVILFATAAFAAEVGKSYPPATKLNQEAGVGIQRTMTLLATSTPEHRNHVRVLFYGQSITEQEWSKIVAEDLRKRFPNADLEIENRAIGGFASQLLVKPAEHDAYPFYPDLVIFHVYGANNTYEEIIKNLRSRTTAEVLMQRDHVTQWPPEKPDQNADKGMWWDHMMNNVFLPEIAKKYGCGLVDVRGAWLEYLKANQLQPRDLLKDGVHLNAHGNYLMAELVKQYLVHRPGLPADSWKDLVTTVEVGKSGKLEFDGNRIDISGGGKAKVLIDGKKPSEFPECYRITRPSPGPWSALFLSRVDHTTPLVLEEWTITIHDVAADGKSWKFDVKGSTTGDDGSGSSKEKFTSKSGRVVIDPSYWFRGSNPPLPSGLAIQFKVLPMFTDEYTPSDKGFVTVAQGLKNEKHTLELIPANGETRATANIYRPPVR
jgi:hypothetical protein